MLRRDWENDTMPFYFVQLAQYKTILPELKWIQAQTLDLIPYSGMATAHDVGEYSCIHPADKETVGDRLAYLALTKDYGFGFIDADTPVPVKFEFQEGQAVVTFKVGAMGLNPRSEEIEGFELAGEDRVFYPAKARVLYGDGNSVKVYGCPQVSHPVAVRYGMSNWCTPTLYNGFGIPASPFRSDNW
jgi:sialate O-acetylesterase